MLGAAIFHYSPQVPESLRTPLAITTSLHVLSISFFINHTTIRPIIILIINDVE